jgi:DNA-binding HxlR family transcriptional regulator
MIVVRDRAYNCEIEFAFSLISGKWKTDILWELTKEPGLGFNELQRRLPGVASKVLAKALDELEDALLVARTSFPGIPTRIEYRLTDSGLGLWKRCEPLIGWAHGHVAELEKERERVRAKTGKRTEAKESA